MKNTSRFRTAVTAAFIPVCAAVLLTAGGSEAGQPRITPRTKNYTCPMAVVLPSPDRVVIARTFQPISRTSWTPNPRSISISKATVEERAGKQQLVCTYGEGVTKPVILRRTVTHPSCTATQPDTFKCRLLAPAG